MSVDVTVEGVGERRARPRPAGTTLPGYAEQAGRYEQRTAAFQAWRQQLVEMLPLKRFAGFDRPWSQLEELVEGLQVADVASGAGYLALARAKAEPLTGPAAPFHRPAAPPPAR